MMICLLKFTHLSYILRMCFIYINVIAYQCGDVTIFSEQYGDFGDYDYYCDVVYATDY